MKLIRFRALLNAYGADAARWPAEERDDALALARREPAVATLLEEAGRIDDLLGAWRVPPPSPALATAVLARACITTRPLSTRLRWWWAAPGLALIGMGGMLAGSAATAALVPAVWPGQAALTAFDPPEQEAN